MAGARVIVHKFADPIYLIMTIEETLQQKPFQKFLPDKSPELPDRRQRTQNMVSAVNVNDFACNPAP
jgi:hypothetical protein